MTVVSTTPTAQEQRLQSLLAMPLVRFLEAVWDTVTNTPWSVSETFVDGVTVTLAIVERLNGSLVCIQERKNADRYWSNRRIVTDQGALSAGGYLNHEAAGDDSEAARREVIRLLSQYSESWSQRMPTGSYLDLSQVSAAFCRESSVVCQLTGDNRGFTVVSTKNNVFGAYCLHELQRWLDPRQN